MIRWHVISAVCARNLKQYFSSALGYVFIIAFVTVAALLTFSPQFFADNLANLDQLTQSYPMLLLFFAPAVAMSVWADERRSGTDAILFTLPASDLEILLGKYFAVASVYTIALAFSFTQLIALSILGNPDWGVILSTYFGYWLAGLALLSIGMFASSLTESTTVAFVAGALFCAIPVWIGTIFPGSIFPQSWFGGGTDDSLSTATTAARGLWIDPLVSFRPEVLGIAWNLHDFTTGLVPLPQVLYFGSLIAFMLYLNLVVISRRHWSRGQQVSLGGQFAVRIFALAIAIIALNYVVTAIASSRFSRVDLTKERLFSLDSTTLAVVDYSRENKKLVTIQAFVSDDVPRRFVNTKKQLLGLLRQLDYYGGNYVDVQVTNVLPNSQEAIAAQRLGIEPQNDRSEVGGRIVEQQIYLGVHVFSELGDVTLPAIQESSSIEYELTRAIASTTDKKRQLTLGIVDTDARFGGPEYDGRRIPWAYSRTLKQLESQFKIIHIRPEEISNYLPPEKPPASGAESEKNEPATTAPKDPPSVLLVPDPASLPDDGASALVRYLQAGHPTLLLMDPLPFYWTYVNPTGIGILNAPRLERISPMSPYREFLTSSMSPKADNGTASRVARALGIEWDNGQCVWSLSNPHPGFQGKWPDYLGNKWPDYYGKFEYAFVYCQHDARANTFDPQDLVSKDLKELLFFYPGSVRKSADAQNIEFTSLVSLGHPCGSIPWHELTQVPSESVPQVDPRTGRRTVQKENVRNQFTGGDLNVLQPSPRTSTDNENRTVVARVRGTGDNHLNAVIISDLDFVADVYFEQQEALGLPLDNLKLLQNALEVLAGEEGFATLRGRRPTPRTLTLVERRINQFRADRNAKQKEKEDSKQQELVEAQNVLDEKLKLIEGKSNLSIFEKLQLASQEAADAQSEFDRKKEKLDRELKQELDQLKLAEQKQISSLESWIQSLAVLLAPLPAVLLGIFVLANRRAKENRYIRPERKV